MMLSTRWPYHQENGSSIPSADSHSYPGLRESVIDHSLQLGRIDLLLSPALTPHPAQKHLLNGSPTSAAVANPLGIETPLEFSSKHSELSSDIAAAAVLLVMVVDGD